MASKSWTEFTPPSKKFIEDLMKPLKAYFDPRFYGLEKIEADRPALYVTHHTVFGLTDGFFLGAEAFLQRGVFLRALVANIHMSIPYWRDIISELGTTAANREVCREMMDAGEHILVFPGGAREA
ncbi:MAG: 1-acyl-sn-glycerol-3-phosphate acyltransferase, partial [Bacteroidota bacterium]